MYLFKNIFIFLKNNLSQTEFGSPLNPRFKKLLNTKLNQAGDSGGTEISFLNLL